MYNGKDNELYGDLEETILACLLIEPELIKELKVEEKHFKKFNYVLTFFKEFYKKYKCLDISMMLSILKGTRQVQMLDVITYLTTIFVVPTRFIKYQDRLLDRYSRDKKEQWLSEKIYEKATRLYMGGMTLQEFYKELKRLNDYVKEKEWK